MCPIATLDNYTSVATQDVDWALGSIASAGGFERAGKLRFIAVAPAHRHVLYPDVPATAELQNLQEFQVSGWAGLFAPHAIDDTQRDRLSTDIGRALAAPEVVENYRTLGYEAPQLDATAFAELIRRETAAWSDTIRKVGLRLDS